MGIPLDSDFRNGALVELYVSFSRQTFIAIDEIQKYSTKAEAILTKQKVIQLSNENQLYIKDWRS
jgi:hypothetical protein